MTGQQRLTEEYDPEGDPAYTFTLTDIDGEEILVKYYEYDASFFYAAVVEDRVYLVNKMDVRDMDEAYQEMITAEKAETKESSEDEEAETEKTLMIQEPDQKKTHQKMKREIQKNYQIMP